MNHEHDTSTARVAGHEPDQVSVLPILWAGVALFSLIAVSLLLMFGLWRGLDRALGDDPTTGIASRDETPVPPGVPQLDPDQSAELVELREAQQEWLNEYQWTDRSAGVARIPIDRAMAIIADDGLPATPPANITDILAPQSNE